MEFVINVYGPTGKQLRFFDHPFKNVPLTRRGLLDHYEEKDLSELGEEVGMKMIREADNLPDTWPALEEIFFDDEDRLWVQRLLKILMSMSGGCLKNQAK